MHFMFPFEWLVAKQMQEVQRNISKIRKIINITFFPDINKLLVCISCSSTRVKIQQSRKLCLSFPIKNITQNSVIKLDSKENILSH